jgi:hypothetical protein
MEQSAVGRLMLQDRGEHRRVLLALVLLPVRARASGLCSRVNALRCPARGAAGGGRWAGLLFDPRRV